MQPQSTTVPSPSSASSDTPLDIFVVGGGINGCGIARDAAGRGYSVSLAEMNDLGSGTSSWSTKLIHGGLRYLEHYEFRLVRESLMEREVLWKNAPHIIRPMRFILPHHKGLRPAWLLRLGLFLYDNLGGRKLLPPTRTLNMVTDEAGKPLKPLFTRGFEYSDCTVDDVRMVILNARDAADRGAEILTRTQVTGLRRDGELWRITLRDTRTGDILTRTARLVVNAAGPWVDRVLNGAAGKNDARNVRLVQGSHIVVKRLFDHDRSYIFQNSDGRIIFAIPYEEDLTLVGTTDKDYEGGDRSADPSKAKITDEEIRYLCAAASEYFAEPITPDDVVWTYSGVRPLFDDGAGKAQEATRDYVLREQETDGPPLINIFGGKITTFRRLAGSMLEKIEANLGRKGAAWTASAPLPGGDFPVTGHGDHARQLAADYPFLSEAHARRLTRLYGTKARGILGDAKSMADLGELFGHDLTEAEVRYGMAHEWARTAEDMLWRRTKLGLRLSKPQVEKLSAFMDREIGTRAAAAE
ncbi:MAG: glycerol-3-phosphate dehydrogenase [Alphaproteobacteria bacterium]|nr:glycerol-3-phosphate dehydrogenase [Alphaproteobacteria bacterium]